MADPGPAPSTAQHPETPPEERIPLLDVLHDLGSTLVQSELPSHSQIPQVLGAVVKVLDHAKVEVADELWPEEPVQVQRPETADAVHRQRTNDRLDRLETLLSDLVGHVKNQNQQADTKPEGEQ